MALDNTVVQKLLDQPVNVANAQKATIVQQVRYSQLPVPQVNIIPTYHKYSMEPALIVLEAESVPILEINPVMISLFLAYLATHVPKVPQPSTTSNVLQEHSWT